MSVEGAAGGGTGITPAVISFSDNSTADNATIISEGGSDYSGGITRFSGYSTAGNATLIAETKRFPSGGMGPVGTILFADQSTGGTASVQAFENGELVIDHSLTMGSIIITSTLPGLINLDFTGPPEARVGNVNFTCASYFGTSISNARSTCFW